MDVLLLCGYFEPKYQEEIGRKTKTWVENAANTFQERLIEGLTSQDISLTVISAPLFGAWPTAYSDIYFNGFEAGESDQNIEYVTFNNVWGYRNISRASSLKKSVNRFLKTSSDSEKAIIIYGAHTPYMEAACYAKKICPSIHLCLVLPDLPQYMNLSRNSHPVYDFFKRIDIQKMQRLNLSIDSYMLLTKHMGEAFGIGGRPYIVVEGLSNGVFCAPCITTGIKKVAYAGKLEESFGVKRLVEAFKMLDNDSVELVICGGGELVEYIRSCSKSDKRITYKGIVPAEEAREILQNAFVLVNPRTNDSDYTKYSFPSKNIEYLQTGNTVVGYMLDGIPEDYTNFMICPDGSSVNALKNALEKALKLSDTDRRATSEKAKNYILAHCEKNSVAKQLIDMIAKEMRE
jgi:glycosyltransferase involved in cell wall biosynthesis